jgi:hypothetical protein
MSLFNTRHQRVRSEGQIPPLEPGAEAYAFTFG